jgi:hypothetical protein
MRAPEPWGRSLAPPWWLLRGDVWAQGALWCCATRVNWAQQDEKETRTVRSVLSLIVPP